MSREDTGLRKSERLCGKGGGAKNYKKNTGTLGSVRRRTKPTREEDRAPVEIPKVTGTIYGLDDGEWYLLDNGEVAAENRPSFLKHLFHKEETTQQVENSAKDSAKNRGEGEAKADSDDSEKDAYPSDDDRRIRWIQKTCEYETSDVCYSRLHGKQ